MKMINFRGFVPPKLQELMDQGWCGGCLEERGQVLIQSPGGAEEVVLSVDCFKKLAIQQPEIANWTTFTFGGGEWIEDPRFENIGDR